MIPSIEQRLYTDCDQTAIIQPNENNTGLILVIREQGNVGLDTRLYLAFEEADALCKLIQQMKDYVKDGK